MRVRKRNSHGNTATVRATEATDRLQLLPAGDRVVCDGYGRPGGRVRKGRCASGGGSAHRTDDYEICYNGSSLETWGRVRRRREHLCCDMQNQTGNTRDSVQNALPHTSARFNTTALRLSLSPLHLSASNTTHQIMPRTYYYAALSHPSPAYAALSLPGSANIASASLYRILLSAALAGAPLVGTLNGWLTGSNSEPSLASSKPGSGP